MSELLKPYPSGFLGSNTVQQTTADNLYDVKAAVNQMFNRPNTATASKFTSSVEVNSIWSDVLAGGSKVNTFEFKERVIKAAIKSFGTETFAEWLSAQSANPQFTKDHHRFIDETILFVRDGNKRDYTFSNWFLILGSDGLENDTVKYTQIQQTYLLQNNQYQSGRNNTSKTIKEFVMDWVKQNKGIEDLTSSLFVLFGVR